MEKEELAQQATVNQMSVIEMMSVKDKATERIRQIEAREHYKRLHAERLERYRANAFDPFALDAVDSSEEEECTLRERHERKMLAASKRREKTLTYREIFEQEKIAE
jgi:hypothetical protein